MGACRADGRADRGEVVQKVLPAFYDKVVAQKCRQGGANERVKSSVAVKTAWQ